MFLTGPKVVEEVLAEKVGMAELGGTAVHGGERRRAAAGRRARTGRRRSSGRCSATCPRTATRPAARPLAPPPSTDPGALVPASPRQVYDVGCRRRGARRRELAARARPRLGAEPARCPRPDRGAPRRHRRQPAPPPRRCPRLRRLREGRLVHRPLRPLRPARWSCSRTRPASCRAAARSGAGSSATAPGLVRAFARATVPRITVVLRKGFGGAFITMNSKALGADLVLAWPSAEIGIMASAQAVGIKHGREIAADDDPGRAARAARRGLRRRAHDGRGRRGERHRRRADRARRDARPVIAAALGAFGSRRRLR